MEALYSDLVLGGEGLMRLIHANSSDLWLALSRPFPKSEIILFSCLHPLLLLSPSLTGESRANVWTGLGSQCCQTLRPLVNQSPARWVWNPPPLQAPTFLSLLSTHCCFSSTRQAKFNNMRSLCLDILYPHLTTVLYPSLPRSEPMPPPQWRWWFLPMLAAKLHFLKKW